MGVQDHEAAQNSERGDCCCSDCSELVTTALCGAQCRPQVRDDHEDEGAKEKHPAGPQQPDVATFDPYREHVSSRITHDWHRCDTPKKVCGVMQGRQEMCLEVVPSSGPALR